MPVLGRINYLKSPVPEAGRVIEWSGCFEKRVLFDPGNTAAGPEGVTFPGLSVHEGKTFVIGTTVGKSTKRTKNFLGLFHA